MPLEAGTRLGPYEIVAPLGAGAMGEVYKARDARLDRSVAIKVLTAALASDPQFRQRFEREAHALSHLMHPHICTLYDVGQDGPTSFLVMEYIEGETLERLIAAGPIPLDQALQIANEMAEALDSAHRVGIVHRDLKPGNVMLAKSGVKLLDFGVAKFTSRVSDSREDTLTVAGSLIGTVQYMAPEQLIGGNVDARTDIFALGSVLYEMLTRQKAFVGNSQASVIAAILERDSGTDGRQVLDPPGVDRVVRKCLRKNPDERWQTARDLGDEVRWLATSTGATAGTAVTTARTGVTRAQDQTKVRRRRFTFRLTIGFTLSILLMVLVYRNFGRTPAPPPQVARVEPAPAITVSLPAASAPEDPNKALNERDLQAARDMIAAGNLQGALREHLQSVLERDPDNTIALNLKRTAEATLATRATATSKPAPKPAASVEIEIPGIARKTGEAYAEYTARVKGIQVNLTEGKAALDKGEYAVGLARLRLVDRDAPKYQGVDLLIADATAKQQAAVDKAIESGQQNESNGRLMDARRWYDQALQANPSSSIAREKRAAVAQKMNQQATDLFAQGTAALKTGNTQLAKRIFQQVFDSTMPGDEYRDKATKQLQLLK
jgi:tRNA A-37 threonylcarbamoyl transferase component Bud32